MYVLYVDGKSSISKTPVKTPVLLIIIDFYHTNITLAALIGQMI